MHRALFTLLPLAKRNKQTEVPADEFLLCNAIFVASASSIRSLGHLVLVSSRLEHARTQGTLERQEGTDKPAVDEIKNE